MRAVRTGDALSTAPQLADLLRSLFRLQRDAPETALLLESVLTKVGALGEEDVSREAGLMLSLTVAGDTLGALWLDRRWDARAIDRIVSRLASETGVEERVARLIVYSTVIRNRYLFDLPPRLAVEAQIAMLAAFAPVSEVSLWTLSPHGRLSCALLVGAERPGRRARSAAQAALRNGHLVTGERVHVHAVPVRCWGRSYAGLAFRARPDLRDRAIAYANEAAQAIGPFLEIDVLLERNAEHERALVESSERRLVRLGFDLHDGPMQDVAALAHDVRLFRSQLAKVLEDGLVQERVLGRVDDVEARLSALDTDLRELARSLQSPTALRVPLPDVLEHEVNAFRAQSSIRASLRTSGDLGGLTSSQKIAVQRVVQEALSNVREHSGARKVDISVNGTRTRITVEVGDDGVGFAVEERLVAAARAGHLGLVGMGERVRLLGGRFDLDSKPGGPTLVRAVIPRWEPVRSAADTPEDGPEQV